VNVRTLMPRQTYGLVSKCSPFKFALNFLRANAARLEPMFLQSMRDDERDRTAGGVYVAANACTDAVK
jgi:hypothetical protein